MRTFIFYYSAYYLGGIMLIQAKDRIQAEKLFIKAVLESSDTECKKNIFKRASTMSWAINYNEVDVQVIPIGEEHVNVLFSGDD